MTIIACWPEGNKIMAAEAEIPPAGGFRKKMESLHEVRTCSSSEEAAEQCRKLMEGEMKHVHA